MTHEEKAKELVDKFGKQCALMCVDEIDSAIDFDWMEIQNLDRVHNYWQKVKEAIEKHEGK